MISALKKSFTQPVNIQWWLTLLFDWKCFLHIRIHFIEIWLYMRIARMKTQHFHNKSEFYFNFFFFTFKVNITHEIIEIRRKKTNRNISKRLIFIWKLINSHAAMDFAYMWEYLRINMMLKNPIYLFIHNIINVHLHLLISSCLPFYGHNFVDFMSFCMYLFVFYFFCWCS